MARRTRFSKGLSGVTLFGTTTIDTAGTLALDGSTSGKIVTGAVTNNLKVSCGQAAITGSLEVSTGLTTVLSGAANVLNWGAGATDPMYCNVRIDREQTTGQVNPRRGTRTGAGYMTIVVHEDNGDVCDGAASVDWFAVGT